eukprot:1159326-Pelagomonas_calceolata.AAC.2
MASREFELGHFGGFCTGNILSLPGLAPPKMEKGGNVVCSSDIAGAIAREVGPMGGLIELGWTKRSGG